MGVLRSTLSLFVYSLAIVGLATVLFVIFSYGWNGEPPTVELE